MGKGTNSANLPAQRSASTMRIAPSAFLVCTKIVEARCSPGFEASHKAMAYPSAFVVWCGRPVMFRMKIVIEKDRVVIIGAQDLPRLLNVVRHVDHVAFEALGKSAVALLVVFEQKDADRITLRGKIMEAKLAQH